MQTNSDMQIPPLEHVFCFYPHANIVIRQEPFYVVCMISYPYLTFLSLAVAGVMDSLNHLRTPTTSLGKCDRSGHAPNAYHTNDELHTTFNGTPTMFGYLFKSIPKGLIYQWFTNFASPANAHKRGQILGKTDRYKIPNPSLFLIS